MQEVTLIVAFRPGFVIYLPSGHTQPCCSNTSWSQVAKRRRCPANKKQQLYREEMQTLEDQREKLPGLSQGQDRPWDICKIKGFSYTTKGAELASVHGMGQGLPHIVKQAEAA